MYKLYGKVLFQEMRTPTHVNLMSTTVPDKKRGHLGVLLITLAVILTIAPAWVAGYLQSKGRFHISLLALGSLAMFLVGAFLLVHLLKE